MLRKLLPFIGEIFLIFSYLFNEVFFLNQIKNWIIQWRNLIRFFMQESILITTIVYGLYFIFLGIFGLVLGFLLYFYRQFNVSSQYDVSSQNDEIYVFFLLLLLKILYYRGFSNILLNPLEKLSRTSLQDSNIEKFYRLHSQVFEPNNLNLYPFKLFLKESVENNQIPFPILRDPLFLFIEVNFLFTESRNYEFELFQFYLDRNKKIKS
jgi:hypothetical protein